MQMPHYLRSWISGQKFGMQVLFFIILLSAILQFATFALSQNFVISSFGAQPEDISLALQLSYIGILVMLPLQFRLIRYFELRNYLIVTISAGILLSILCIRTDDLLLFFILRFLQGLVVCIISGSMLVIISTFLKAEHKQSVGPSIFYGTVLSSGVLIGLVFANVSVNNDWKTIYLFLIAFQFLSLLLVILVFSGNSGLKKYPLYQIDWMGALFFLLSAISLAYTLIYGSKYYWFSDGRIRLSAVLSICGAALYLRRSATLKRPLIDLSAFKNKQFWSGLLLLGFYYGSKESLNLIFGYASNILQWSTPEVMTLGLFNVVGLLIFMAISARLIITKSVPIPALILAGFLVLLFYHYWMYDLFSPDLAYTDLILPMFLQGAASGLLFVPIMIFTLSALPPTTGMTGLIVAAYTRFITLLNVSAGFYNLQLYYNQLFKEGFLPHLTLTDQALSERLDNYRQVFASKGISAGQAEALANMQVSKTAAIQSQLLANRAIFLLLAYLIALALLLIILALLIGRLRRNKSQRALAG